MSEQELEVVEGVEPVTATLTLPEKFGRLRDVMNTELIERRDEVQTSIIAIVARKHHVQIGPPGIAKSFLVRTLVSHISGVEDGQYFEWLFTRFTTPEEVFGPPSLKALENDEYRRNTRHKLPESYFAFLDEAFKANSAILNSLLTILNERKFYNNGDNSDVPLATVFFASNEYPDGEELSAMSDRIHFWHEVNPMREQGNFIRMLSAKHDKEPEQIVSWAEIQQAQNEAAEVELPEHVIETVADLRGQLRQEGIEPTERRFRESLGIIQAMAWLDGRNVADTIDLRPLQHVYWNKPEERPLVKQLVLGTASPLDKDAMELQENVQKLSAQLEELLRDQTNKNVRNKQGIEIHGKLEDAKKELDGLRSQASASNRKSEVLDQLEDTLYSTTKALLKDIFHIDVDPTI